MFINIHFNNYNCIFFFRKTVVCPVIDVISDDTFEYVTASDMTWGGFNWKLNFRWCVIQSNALFALFNLILIIGTEFHKEKCPDETMIVQHH